MPLKTFSAYNVFIFLKILFFVASKVFFVCGKLPSAVTINSEELKASNPYNLQTETLSWDDSSAQCIQSCQNSEFSLERLVIKFDKKFGKCECYRNLEEGLFASNGQQIPEETVVFYTGIHYSANLFMNTVHRWF